MTFNTIVRVFAGVCAAALAVVAALVTHNVVEYLLAMIWLQLLIDSDIK